MRFRHSSADQHPDRDTLGDAESDFATNPVPDAPTIPNAPTVPTVPIVPNRNAGLSRLHR